MGAIMEAPKRGSTVGPLFNGWTRWIVARRSTWYLLAMKIVSWNVNGIRSAERKGFLDWLEDSDADLIFLQEVRALPEQMSSESRSPEGWSTHFFPAQRKGYSGVGIYARTEPDEVRHGFGPRKFSVEGRSIMARYGDLCVWGCYFPNGGNDLARVPYKLDYYKALLRHINKQRRDGDRVLVCGDFNTAHREIDLARPAQNRKNTGFLPEECAWVQKWVDGGWIDTFRHVHGDVPDRYSWWSFRSGARERNVGWRLDYVFADEALTDRIVHADIHHEDTGSDHCPVSVELRD
jgi:exodeoxyribonuclease-3